MHLNEDVQWLELRVKLLKRHLREKQQLLDEQAEVLHVLLAIQMQEREQLKASGKMCRLKCAQLLVRQGEELTNLYIANSQERHLLSARQDQEALALEHTISQQQNGFEADDRFNY